MRLRLLRSKFTSGDAYFVSMHKRLYSTIPVEREKLSPHWVTGFSDAESSFSLMISKKSTSRSG